MEMVRNGSSHNGATSPRRRNARPEQIALNIGRCEHLIIEIRNAAAITQLLDGIESRVAALEDAPVPGMTLHNHDVRLRKVEEDLKRSNGHDRGAA